MSPEDRAYLDKKFDRLEALVSKVNRGVYGDSENKVPGLIDYQLDHNKRIKSLEATRKKVMWSGGAVIAILELGWHGIKEWAKEWVK